MTKKRKYEILLQLAKWKLEEHKEIVKFKAGFNPVKKTCLCPQCEMLREVVNDSKRNY
jgi:hypothetical protein